MQDDYRIVSFGPDADFDGHNLYINPAIPLKYRPSPELLRSHFKQCVLANMKGAGARDDLWDREDSHDLSGQVWQKASGGYSRLELELATRLKGVITA